MQSTPVSQEQARLDLRDYLGILLRYKWLMLGCLVAGVTLGVYWGSGTEQRPEYKASALIKVGKKASGFLPPGYMEERTFAEEMEIVKSQAFLERVARRMKDEIEVLSVKPPRANQFVQLKSWLLGQRDVSQYARTTVAPVTLRDRQVSQEARRGVYTLVFTDAHTFVVSPEGSEEASRTGELEHRFTGWGFSFIVTGGPVKAEMRLVLRARPLEEIIDSLRGSIAFAPMKETNLLRVSTTSPDPARAKEYARIVIEEFVAFGRHQSEQEAAQSLAYMTQQLE